MAKQFRFPLMRNMYASFCEETNRRLPGISFYADKPAGNSESIMLCAIYDSNVAFDQDQRVYLPIVTIISDILINLTSRTKSKVSH